MKLGRALAWLTAGALFAVLGVRGEEAWVWSSKGRSLDGPPSSRQYEDRRPYRPADLNQPKFADYDRPPAPIYENNGEIPPPQPSPFRPGPRPTYRPPYRPPLPGGGLGGGGGGGGILTGPRPSWEHQDGRKYRDYSLCKCAFSFNCPSPGLLFGSCDVDKQYCCSDEKRGRYEPGPGFQGRYEPGPGFQEGRYEPGPGFQGHDRPVLVGPGGPTGVPGGGYGPDYRPPPRGDLYEPYARSAASADSKKNKN